MSLLEEAPSPTLTVAAVCVGGGGEEWSTNFTSKNNFLIKASIFVCIHGLSLPKGRVQEISLGHG